MSARHRAREAALQFLFSLEAPSDQTKDSDQMKSALAAHFSHFEVSETMRVFARELVLGVISHQVTLDEEISKNSDNWKIPRMPVMDRCLLRLAAFELLHCKETPGEVVINEAVELAKQFGTTESPPFVNGILDALYKKHTRS